MKKVIIFFLATLSICVAQTVEKTSAISDVVFTAKEKNQQNLEKVVIFINNDSNEELLSKKVNLLESNLSAKLNDMGFGVISYGLVMKKLDDYLNSDDTEIKKFAKELKQEIGDKKSVDKNTKL